MSIFRSYLKDNVIVFIGHALIQIKGLVLLPIIIKTAGTTIYGGYVLVTTVLRLFFGISSFGAGFRYRRFMPSTEDRGERQVLFYPQFYFQLLVIGVFCLAAIPFAPIIKGALLEQSIEFSLWLIPTYLILFTFYSQLAGYYRYTRRMIYFSLATLFFPYLTIAIVIYYSIYQQLNINTLLSANIFALLLVALPLLLKATVELHFRMVFYRLKELVADIKLGFPLVLGYVVDFILSGSDRLIIASFISVAAVGYYNPAYTLGSLIIILPKISGVVMPPLLSRCVDSGQEEEARKIVDTTLKIFLMAAIPFIVGSYMFSEPLLRLLANEEVASQAKLVTPIVALGVLFYGLFYIFNTIFFIRLKTNYMFKVSSLAAVMNLILNVIFLYLFRNILVAAMTTLIAYLMAFIYAFKMVRTVWEIHIDIKMLAKVLIAAVGMGLFIHAVNSLMPVALSGHIGIILGEILLGIGIYTGLTLMMGVIQPREWAVLFISKNKPVTDANGTFKPISSKQP